MTPPNSLRVAVFGVGAVGGYFGGRLAEAGNDVTFIARGDTLEALRSNGLHVDSINGDFVIQPAQTATDTTTVGPVDLVLLGVKAWQVEEVAPVLAPVLGEDTVVLPLQNGVEAIDQLTRALGTRNVVGGLCKIICFKAGAGYFRHAGATPYVALNEIDNRPSERIERVRRAFEQAGVAVEVPADIQAAIWSKFLFITSVSGIGAATRVSIGELRDQPQTRALLEEAMREVAEVARAAGVDLAEELLASTLQFIDSLPAEGTASMQRDIMDGRPSELDSQTGAVVRLGRQLGVPVPLNSTLYALLQPLERRARAAAAP